MGAKTLVAWQQDKYIIVIINKKQINLLVILNHNFMKTIRHVFKSTLFYHGAYLIVIFASVICIFACIHKGYEQWFENKTLRTASSQIHQENISNRKQQWHLSSVPLDTDMNVSPHQQSHAQEALLSGVVVSGIIHSSNKSISRAILQENGEQNVYAINDYLKSSSKIRVTGITKNQIMFSSGEQTLQLTLLAELAQPSGPQGAVASRQEQQAVTLADFIDASPVVDKNTLRGLRLLPRKQVQFFKHSSLEPGDIAIQLNNIKLTQQANLGKAQNALKHLKMAQFTVLRNASPRLINVSVQQFQDGKED
ncbi:type II secretion system protein GspC [Citrobacter cronae]|uniref:type II secretion system protein GspC n=1 Tax=Citrobacter TaxID=544 RepID=UPI000A0F6AB4|nr:MULTISPECIES: type II secretion system protein GspC [Citrobacter]MBJ8365512.1 type II secretion system protein GspC [Citrobacter cronae]MBY6246763.1 type II secretion system protein GspC [Citrobacter werkmanii]MBY6250719.1 type II secretion system protein GspC [Citrobacter werkmanii]NBD81344.1 type II secretion system protein GspC [Citrobacter werkmanii]ORT70379.1 type II secretion system protein GspC [Citrobacter werkmanii]